MENKDIKKKPNILKSDFEIYCKSHSQKCKESELSCIMCYYEFLKKRMFKLLGLDDER